MTAQTLAEATAFASPGGKCCCPPPLVNSAAGENRGQAASTFIPWASKPDRHADEFTLMVGCSHGLHGPQVKNQWSTWTNQVKSIMDLPILNMQVNTQT